MSVEVKQVTVRSEFYRTAQVTIADTTGKGYANFYDLPEDMRKALREWVGADDIWRDGWVAHNQEWEKQKNDPDYPIGRDMPDWTRVP